MSRFRRWRISGTVVCAIAFDPAESCEPPTQPKIFFNEGLSTILGDTYLAKFEISLNWALKLIRHSFVSLQSLSFGKSGKTDKFCATALFAVHAPAQLTHYMVIVAPMRQNKRWILVKWSRSWLHTDDVPSWADFVHRCGKKCITVWRTSQIPVWLFYCTVKLPICRENLIRYFNA